MDENLTTFSFPFAINIGGSINASGGDEAIRGKIIQVLFTAPGERDPVRQAPSWRPLAGRANDIVKKARCCRSLNPLANLASTSRRPMQFHSAWPVPAAAEF